MARIKPPYQAAGDWVGTVGEDPQTIGYVRFFETDDHRNRRSWTQEERADTARFIATACNSHDGLLNACKQVVEKISMPPGSPLLALLKAEIAKAE